MKTLHLHQNQAVRHLCAAGSAWRVVVMPTGSGKTAAVKAAVALVRDRFASVLVITPQLTIESTFRAADEYLVEDGDGNSRLVQIDEDFWAPAVSGEDYTFAGCQVRTHSQVIAWLNGGFLADRTLMGHVLVVDEAHHGGKFATKLYNLCKSWVARGGVVWSITATPYRADQELVYDATADVYHVSYTELVANGFGMPERFEVRFLEMEDLRVDYDAVAQYVLGEQRPTMVRIQPTYSMGRCTADNGDALVDALARHGCTDGRALHIIGDLVTDDGVLLPANVAVTRMFDRERLTAETTGYNQRSVDVIVACGRGLEGADWTMCSHAVLVGVPTSPVTVVQVLGRALRNKRQIADYPQAWVDNSILTFIVPKVDAADRPRHARDLVMLLCHLEDPSTAVDYQRLWTNCFKHGRLPPRVRDALQQALRPSNPTAEIEGRKVLAQALVQSEVLVGKPSIGLVLRSLRGIVADAEDPSAVEAQVLAGVNLIQAYGVDAAKQALGEALPQVLKAVQDMVSDAIARGEPFDALKLAARSAYHDKMWEVLKQIGDAYRGEIKSFDGVFLRGVKSVATRTLIRDVVSEMRRSRDGALNVAADTGLVNVVGIIRAFRAEHLGKAPTIGHGAQDLSKLVGFRYYVEDLDRSIRRMYPGMTLAHLVQAVDLGWLDHAITSTQLARALKGANVPVLSDRFWRMPFDMRECAHNPRFRVKGLPWADHFVALELALRYGWRGLPGGSTLRDFTGTARAAAVHQPRATRP